jgi:hypothetical protein
VELFFDCHALRQIALRRLQQHTQTITSARS